MKYVQGVKTANGEEVLSYKFIEELRKREDPFNIIAQKGGQEDTLASPANIIVTGGNRGGGKTGSLVFFPLEYIQNPHFFGLVLRNEKDDLKGIIEQTTHFYQDLGTYKASKMVWDFNSSSTLQLSYYGDNYSDFETRFRGQAFPYIGIDELTQISFKKFKFLLTTNRNSFGMRNMILGTCNPDPTSWVARFIDWWIGDDGLPIEQRNGKIRYCFMDGDTTSSIIWGNTRQEVYQQCKPTIDKLYNDNYKKLGYDKLQLFIKSVTFIRARLEDNIVLIKSDPNYVANLAQQSEEQRARDFEGNWRYKDVGDDLIKLSDMDRMFNNDTQAVDDGTRYVTCDVAFTGGDSLVLWLWIGWHIADIFVSRIDARTSVEVVKTKLAEWGVSQEHFCYDLQGAGQVFKGFFPDALPFNNQEEPIPQKGESKRSVRYLYGNLKSQCAYFMAKMIKQGEITINPQLLARKFTGRFGSNVPLMQILLKERKAIRPNEKASDKGFTLIKKEEMKKIVGHSPDYIESLVFRFLFQLKRNRTVKGLWMV